MKAKEKYITLRETYYAFGEALDKLLLKGYEICSEIKIIESNEQYHDKEKKVYYYTTLKIKK